MNSLFYPFSLKWILPIDFEMHYCTFALHSSINPFLFEVHFLLFPFFFTSYLISTHASSSYFLSFFCITKRHVSSFYFFPFFLPVSFCTVQFCKRWTIMGRKCTLLLFSFFPFFFLHLKDIHTYIFRQEKKRFSNIIEFTKWEKENYQIDEEFVFKKKSILSFCLSTSVLFHISTRNISYKFLTLNE